MHGAAQRLAEQVCLVFVEKSFVRKPQHLSHFEVVEVKRENDDPGHEDTASSKNERIKREEKK